MTLFATEVNLIQINLYLKKNQINKINQLLTKIPEEGLTLGISRTMTSKCVLKAISFFSHLSTLFLFARCPHSFPQQMNCFIRPGMIDVRHFNL